MAKNFAEHDADDNGDNRAVTRESRAVDFSRLALDSSVKRRRKGPWFESGKSSVPRRGYYGPSRSIIQSRTNGRGKKLMGPTANSATRWCSCGASARRPRVSSLFWQVRPQAVCADHRAGIHEEFAIANSAGPNQYVCVSNGCRPYALRVRR